MFVIGGNIIGFLFAIGVITFAIFVLVFTKSQKKINNKKKGNEKTINNIWTKNIWTKEEEKTIENFIKNYYASIGHLALKSKIKNKYIHNYYLPSSKNKYMTLTRTTKFTKQNVIFCSLKLKKMKNIPYAIFLSKLM